MQDVGLISGRSLGEGSGNPLCILAWEIPWTAEPGGSQKSRLTDEMTPTRISLKVKESFSKNNHKSLKKNNDSYFIISSNIQSVFKVSLLNYVCVVYVPVCMCVHMCLCVYTVSSNQSPIKTYLLQLFNLSIHLPPLFLSLAVHV